MFALPGWTACLGNAFAYSIRFLSARDVVRAVELETHLGTAHERCPFLAWSLPDTKKLLRLAEPRYSAPKPVGPVIRFLQEKK